MAQRTAVRHPEPVFDAWSRAWGDPALQELGRRLEISGFSEEQAATAVEQVWLFYSYEALPKLRDRLPMGIALDTGNELARIFLFLPVMDGGRERVELKYATPALTPHDEVPNPASDLLPLAIEWIEAPWPQYLRAGWLSDAFPKRVREQARHRQVMFVGIFEDDLAAELQTVMESDDVPIWLSTPNPLFGNQAPSEFLDDPLDRRLRDILTRAKFNLSAT